jgi:uncharacterized protein (TIGR03067 family)
MSKATPLAEEFPAEWKAALHEEVDRLADRYRQPVVLCYLEGKTHAEAASELGWPLGTVKGRLARARDLLRARLTRRGLTLTAGGFAAALAQSTVLGNTPPALLGATLRAALSFAAGKTLPAGAVSAHVVTLTKRALQMTATTRFTILAPFLLTLGGLGFGLFYFPASREEQGDQRAGQAAQVTTRASAAAPLPPGLPPKEIFGRLVNGLRATITLPKTKFEVGEAIPVTYVVKNFSKTEQTLWHCGFWPNHEVDVLDFVGNAPPLTEFGRQCRKAFAPGGERLRNVAVKVPADGADAAYEKYDLTKLYDLSKPGRYIVLYTYEEKHGGWEGRLESNEATFEVVDNAPGKNAVEKDGLRFEILIPDREWQIPENGARTAVKLALRITNQTNQPVRFTRFDTLFPQMIGADGKAPQGRRGRRETRPLKESDTPLVKPGHSATFDIDASLFWQGGKLRLGGSDGFGGIWWFEDLKPGRYQVRIWHVNQATVLKDIWTGDIKTPFVEVSLVAPPAAKQKNESDMAESEPFRSDGLEFVAFLPKRIPNIPGTVALGLRVKNVSDKPLTIAVFDVIRLWLIDPASGKRWGADIGRDGSPKPLAPVALAPGASWTWQPRARLDATTDRAKRFLHGPDGLGVAGFWSFGTLTAPRYRLVIEYANSNPKQGDVPLWVGKATTKEVEFALVKDDISKMQGTWRLVAGEEGGIAIPPQNFGRNTHLIISGSTATFKSGLRVASGSITVDETKSPKWIDQAFGKNVVSQGIYELNGDTLRLYLEPSGAERPKEFKTKEGTLQRIHTYERFNPENIGKMSVEVLIATFESTDGKERAAATAELFRRGKEVLPTLRKFGAKQIAPTGGTVDGTRRRDIVSSLLEGLPANKPQALAGYRTDSFGLHVDQKTTAADVEAMGKKYGFAILGDFRAPADGNPNCYVRIRMGSLSEVITRLLSEAPEVTTVNLNYFEK